MTRAEVARIVGEDEPTTELLLAGFRVGQVIRYDRLHLTLTWTDEGTVETVEHPDQRGAGEARRP